MTRLCRYTVIGVSMSKPYAREINVPGSAHEVFINFAGMCVGINHQATDSKKYLLATQLK